MISRRLLAVPVAVACILACTMSTGVAARQTVATSVAVDEDRAHLAEACALGLPRARTSAAVNARAVTGAPLAVCGLKPVTGFLRDGYCRTESADVGAHTVCGIVSAQFLAFSNARGNDLVTARGGFPGLVPGDRWCLCESRVREALAAGVAVPIDLAATNTAASRTLTHAQLDTLGALAPTTATTATAASR